MNEQCAVHIFSKWQAEVVISSRPPDSLLFTLLWLLCWFPLLLLFLWFGHTRPLLPAVVLLLFVFIITVTTFIIFVIVIFHDSLTGVPPNCVRDDLISQCYPTFMVIVHAH